MARAAAHLHGRGLLHGDLYAHNTLWDGAAGAAVLGDFGAAGRLPPGAAGAGWGRIETRAWGILLGELLDRATAVPAALRDLERACRQPDVRAMAEVAEALSPSPSAPLSPKMSPVRHALA